MKKEIKSGIIIGLTALSTIIIGGIVYGAVSNSVTSGTPLTANMWNEMAGNYQYSLDEVNTGKKWIDGKDIYRKCFNINNTDIPTANIAGMDSMYINHGITNLNSLVNFYGSLKNGTNSKLINMVYPLSQGQYRLSLINLTPTQIQLGSDELGWFRTNSFAGYSCLEYTKN